MNLINITPVMTSNTTPAPFKVIGSNSFNGSYPPYLVFDSNDDNCYISADGIPLPWIGMTFDKDVRVDAVEIVQFTDTSASFKTFVIEGSKDEITWEQVSDVLTANTSAHSKTLLNIKNNKYFKSYRVRLLSNGGRGNYSVVKRITFYHDTDLDIFVIIKSNDKYYTIEESSLVEITDEITNDLIMNRGVQLSLLNESMSILPDKFKIISCKSDTLSIKSLKSKSQLIVASNNFSTSISEHIDYFKAIYEKNTDSTIKLAISIDNGMSWKGDALQDLNIDIPLKYYIDMSDDEKTKWNNAKEIILNSGIDVDGLESIDFNLLDTDKIRFAYALSINNVDDICNTTKLQWQFDAKGSMQLMDSSEVTVEILSDTIKVTPKVETELMKVNFTNGGSSNMDVQLNPDIEGTLAYKIKRLEEAILGM